MGTMRDLRIAIMAMALVALMTPYVAVSQTRVKAPSNPIAVEKDVELGREAAAEVERQLPVLRDGYVERYVDSVGRRLVSAIPAEFRHPQFNYSFKVVNASDINAFALPGGFTYINRGLIEAAETEGELAGVMAHEISHVALRHGTAQYAKAQKFAWGALGGQILGAIIGGGLGSVVAQGSQLGIGMYFLKYSREYEREADTLGAQIMAGAGYDPRDLANMFRTIERAGGRGGPEWLSSHPNPGNRYEAINREAAMLRVSDPVRNTPEFDRVQARLRDMPGAQSMQQIQRTNQRYPQSSPTGRVQAPSSRFRTYSPGNLFRVAIPDNWRQLPGGETVTFAPEGAFGEVQGRFVFTHGVMTGVAGGLSRNLRQATDQLLSSLRSNNPNLRQQSGYRTGRVQGRNALTMTLSNFSDITGRNEIINLYTTQLGNGDLFYILAVAPQNEYRNYERTFQTIMGSVQLLR